MRFLSGAFHFNHAFRHRPRPLHMGGKGATLKTDLRKIVQIARESGYRGYLPIETLPVPGEEYDPRARVHQCLQELRAALME
jgi:hypothetical protein